MASSQLLLLPANGQMAYKEQIEAEELVAEKIKEEYRDFEDLFDFALYDLFDQSDGNDGAQPWKYKEFIQWIFKLMLLLTNAIELNNKLGTNGGRYLQKLIDFFESLSDKEEAIWAYCHWFNMSQNMRGTSTKE